MLSRPHVPPVGLREVRLEVATLHVAVYSFSAQVFLPSMRPQLVRFLADGFTIFAFIFKFHSVSLTPAKWMNVGKDSFQHFIVDVVRSGTN